MKLLELFSGTQSVSRAVSFDTVVSVDILKKSNPTHCVDIMVWDFTMYAPGYFDVVWASPPCTEYSKAKSRGVRDLESANRMVVRTLEVIAYFQPKLWFIENPQTGLLKRQPFMARLPFFDVDYCQYGFGYRKRTRVWTNLPFFEPKLCPGAGKCPQMVGRKHVRSCGNGRCCYTDRAVPLTEKYSVPEALVRKLFASGAR